MGSGINLLDQLDEEFTQTGVGQDQGTEAGGKKRGLSLSLGGGSLSSRDQIRALVTMIFASAAYFGPNYYEQTLNEKTAIKRRELNDVNARIQKQERIAGELRAIREEMVEYDKRMQDLRRKIRKLETLDDHRNYIVRAVNFFVTQMPNDIWLDTVQVSRGGSGSMEVTGYSSDLQSVGNFMKTLESAVFYPVWILESTSHVDKEVSNRGSQIEIPRDVKKFQIKAKLMEP